MSQWLIVRPLAQSYGHRDGDKCQPLKAVITSFPHSTFRCRCGHQILVCQALDVSEPLRLLSRYSGNCTYPRTSTIRMRARQDERVESRRQFGVQVHTDSATHRSSTSRGCCRGALPATSHNSAPSFTRSPQTYNWQRLAFLLIVIRADNRQGQIEGAPYTLLEIRTSSSYLSLSPPTLFTCNERGM